MADPTRAVRIHLHPTGDGLSVCLSTADNRHLAYVTSPSEQLALARYLIATVETSHRYRDLALPLHRTEANHGVPCSTCDGGGCPDCTDPA